MPNNDVKHALIDLEKLMLIELTGRVYMLTAKAYHIVKSDIQYTQDQTITYLKTKNLILDYLETHQSTNNEIIRELCRYTKKQASTYTKKR